MRISLLHIYLLKLSKQMKLMLGKERDNKFRTHYKLKLLMRLQQLFRKDLKSLI